MGAIQKQRNMKTELYLIENGKEVFITDLSADAFDSYAKQSKEIGLAHTIQGEVLTISGKIVFKRVRA